MYSCSRAASPNVATDCSCLHTCYSSQCTGLTYIIIHFALAARPDYVPLDSSLHGQSARSNANIHPRSWKTMPKNSEIDPRISRKSDKIQDQVDPKCSQNEAKSDTKPKQPLQDALGDLRRRLSSLSRKVQEPTWRPKSKKNLKNNNIKNH